MDTVATPKDLERWDADTAAASVDHTPPSIQEVVETQIVPQNDGSLSINRAQDVEPILEHCKELAATGQIRSPSGDLHHAAEFPAIIVERYCVGRGITFGEFMRDSAHVKAMLADPSLSLFRVYSNSSQKLHR